MTPSPSAPFLITPGSSSAEGSGLISEQDVSGAAFNDTETLERALRLAPFSFVMTNCASALRQMRLSGLCLEPVSV